MEDLNETAAPSSPVTGTSRSVHSRERDRGSADRPAVACILGGDGCARGFATTDAALAVLDATPAMLWRAAGDGSRTFFSRAWLEFTGRLPEEEAGWGWLDNVHPDDRHRCREAYEEALRTSTDVHIDFRLQRHDGEYRWLAEHGAPVFTGAGDFAGHAGSCTDVTARKLLAARLEEASEQLAALVDSIPDAVVLKDGRGRWQLANTAARRLFGVGETDWRGRSDLELAGLHPHVQDGITTLAEGHERAAEAGGRHDSVELVPGPDGLPRYLEITRVPLLAADGTPRGLVMLGRNATERRLAEDALRLAASVFEHNPQGIMITDPEARILRVNAAFSRITGYAPEEVLGRTPNVLASGTHDRAFYEAMWSTLLDSGRWSGEVWNRRRTGEVYPEWLDIVAVRDENGRVGNYVGTFADIGERKQVQAEIHRLTYTDALTGLGNRRFVEESLGFALSQARSTSGGIALVFVELDRVAALNDAAGHAAADAAVRSAGERLAAAVAGSGVVARWDGEQFAVLLQDRTAAPSALAAQSARVAEQIRASLAEPFAVDGLEVRLASHQAIALFPQDADDAPGLLRCAASALRDLKRQGPGATCFYNAGVDAEARERHRMEQDLRRAHERGELCLHYQPQVDAVSGAVTGAEALLRWRRAERGFVPAADFVPLAEETDLILPLGAFALEGACTQLAAWRAAGVAVGRVAVNVSARQLLQADFVDTVTATLAASGIEAGALELEITETALVAHRDDVLGALAALRLMGVRIALDDFGTGYSNLQYLKRLPIDALKIDRSFVAGIPDEAEGVAIALAICTMARSLGLRVVAEGVETPEQAKFLRALGAAELQGYHVGRPGPPEDLAAFAAAPGANGRRR